MCAQINTGFSLVPRPLTDLDKIWECPASEATLGTVWHPSAIPLSSSWAVTMKQIFCACTVYYTRHSSRHWHCFLCVRNFMTLSFSGVIHRRQEETDYSNSKHFKYQSLCFEMDTSDSGETWAAVNEVGIECLLSDVYFLLPRWHYGAGEVAGCDTKLEN